jgi:ABC-type transporter Mla MlaB component
VSCLVPNAFTKTENDQEIRASFHGRLEQVTVRLMAGLVDRVRETGKSVWLDLTQMTTFDDHGRAELLAVQEAAAQSGAVLEVVAAADAVAGLRQAGIIRVLLGGA